MSVNFIDFVVAPLYLAITAMLPSVQLACDLLSTYLYVVFMPGVSGATLQMRTVAFGTRRCKRISKPTPR